MDIIETDFGTVKLSQRTLDWLNSIDSNWRKIITSKRRGKHRTYVKEQVRRLEDAASVVASISWFAKDILKEF